MSELDKMKKGEMFDTSTPEVEADFKHARALVTKLRTMSTDSEDYREVIEELIPGIPKTSVIVPPFYCDHGHAIHLGEYVFINANCTFLDGADIEIGDHTLIGPDVKIYLPTHPFDYMERRKTIEFHRSVKIGQDCWIGGGAIILPGVTIGDRVIIGAGSVVTHDVEDDMIVAGNPAKVIRKN